MRHTVCECTPCLNSADVCPYPLGVIRTIKACRRVVCYVSITCITLSISVPPPIVFSRSDVAFSFFSVIFFLFPL